MLASKISPREIPGIINPNNNKIKLLIYNNIILILFLKGELRGELRSF